MSDDTLDALLCQCCLLRRTPQRCLTTLFIHMGITEIYSEMLKECFDIQLNSGSEKCGICSVCVGRLRDASNFKQQVQRSQLELRKRLARALGIEHDVKLEYTVEDGTRDYSPEEPAAVKAETAGDEEDGMRDSSPGEEYDVKLEPLTGSDSEATVEDGTRDYSPDEGPSVKLEKSDGTPSDEDCISREEHDVKSEPLTGSDSEDTVEDGTRDYSSEEPAAVKVETAGDEEDGTRDSSPDEGPSVKSEKSDGVPSDEDCMSRKYICDICNKAFTRKDHLKRHVRIHTGQKPFSCDICNKQFTVKHHLQRHARIHTGQKPFRCDKCNKQFTQEGHLKSHVRMHTGQKPFSCNICNKQFADKSNLGKHIRTHTRQKPFSCDICKKQFTRTEHLQRHVRIHTGQKPFICNICNKAFTRKDDLQRHVRSHIRAHTGHP